MRLIYNLLIVTRQRCFGFQSNLILSVSAVGLFHPLANHRIDGHTTLALKVRLLLLSLRTLEAYYLRGS